MKTEFIDYTEAIALKELGFDEPCFSIYYSKDKSFSWHHHKDHTNDEPALESGEFNMSAPLYQQAFRFFREKHGLIYSIGHIGHTNTWAYEIINMRIAGPDYGYGETYEEAELACLKKLIEIVKK